MAFSRRQIVFFHPDLGIGGAERLVIDAAVSLQDMGHKVVIFTSHCDKSHCFEEARDGRDFPTSAELGRKADMGSAGTLDVRVRGNSIVPHSLLGRFSILCAILRQLHLVLQISFFTSELQKLDPEIFFVDQLSACVPVLRWKFPLLRILFYCHFPDKLLAQRGGLIKSIYRLPFDWLESFSTGASDLIVVNSNFTKSIFSKAFPGLSHRRPKVVYPCVNVDESPSTTAESSSIVGGKKLLLSINRFERKKDVGLAIRAYAQLTAAAKERTCLIVAGRSLSFHTNRPLLTVCGTGGYDPRIAENVSYHKSLCEIADSLHLSHSTLRDASSTTPLPRDTNIIFLPSVPNSVKTTLLDAATLLVYTPSFEHFGIVPLEAMLARKPVLAANNGGPTETVVDGETGWLRDPSEVSGWSEVMEMAVRDGNEDVLRDMGEKGRTRVVKEFSKAKMAQRLQEAFDRMLAARTRPAVLDDKEILILLGLVLLVGLFGAFLGALVIRDRISINVDSQVDGASV